MMYGPHNNIDITPEQLSRYEKNLDFLVKHNIKHINMPINIRKSYSLETIMDLLKEKGFTYTFGYPAGDWGHFPDLTAWTVRLGDLNTIIDKDKKESFTREIQLNKISDYVFAGTPILAVNAVIST